jgi:hypothetical protein
MESMNNLTAEGGPSTAQENARALNAKNKLQFALALEILRSSEETRDIFSNIQDETQLLEPDPEHPEIEQYVVDALARIRDDVRNMVISHPEVVDTIASKVGDSFDYPLSEIDLTEAKKLLPKHFNSIH